MNRVKKVLDFVSTILVVVAASVLLWTLYGKDSAQAEPAPVIAAVTGQIPAQHLTNSIGTGPLAIVEFSDFQCPFCARHSTETIPALTKALEGKARYIVVNLPLGSHPYAISAAEAAECAAEQKQYWPMHDLLFAKQQELPTANYVQWASDLGLSPKQFDACLNADIKLSKVNADKALAAKLQVNGTPTIFLGRMRADGGVDIEKRVGGAVPLETLLAGISTLTKENE